MYLGDFELTPPGEGQNVRVNSNRTVLKLSWAETAARPPPCAPMQSLAPATAFTPPAPDAARGVAISGLRLGPIALAMPTTAGPALPATSHDATAPGQALAVPPAPRIRVRRALDGNLYSYAQFRDWYGEEASYRCWFQAPLDDVSEETAAFVLELFRRGIVLGLDGSLLDDGDLVFVVNPMWNGVWREWNEDDHLTLRKIDYWHGVVGDQAVCQMCRDETNYAADELISACHGFTAQRITHLQKRWRQWLIKSLVFAVFPTRLHMFAALIASFLH